MAATIVHRLGLALRLIDTTTGFPVQDRAVRILWDGETVHPMFRTDGSMIFLDSRQEDFTLDVSLPGFEPCRTEVRYGKLDPQLPLVELHMIPADDYRLSRYPCLGVEGTMPGIQTLDGVRAGESPCLIREQDPRRRLITIFNPHNLELNRTWYALVDPDRGVYEPFAVARRVNDQQYKLDRPLEMEFRNYFPICPLVFGSAAPNGKYRLKVRDDATSARWILRWVAGEQTNFATLDLRVRHQLEPTVSGVEERRDL